MRLVGHLTAAVAMREVPEEYAPERGITQREMIDFIKGVYSFSSHPPVDAPPGSMPVMVFANGKFISDKESFAINMLVMESTGDIVQTVTTDQADFVIDDLTMRLDQELGFRFSTASKEKKYISNVVVEFDAEIEKYMNLVKKMISEISNAIPGDRQIGLKRLAFGAPTMRAPTSQIETVEMSDFLIERRAEAPAEQNRYFCSAPMRTRDHLQLLEKLESIMLGGIG